MARSSMWVLVTVGVVVHFLLLSAVLDIYFVSPIQKGMTPHKAGGVAPAKRVVLLIADGLRAESLYSAQQNEVAPFLSSVIQQTGSWGISHTQVPTESRPGHIAILAGFYEDPSAIMRGWKYNPVEFDSVINQSINSWCWGSPDIVDMFNRDDLSHIHLHSYDSYMQDFAGKDTPPKLDSWVFAEVHEFLHNQKTRQCTDACADGNIFFLHLLGVDTAGHSFKPHSQTYLNTIKLVDEGIQNIVKEFDNFFTDNQTTYIFTSDHGMTNWGSHGAGSSHETDVPFITWGAGIARNLERLDVEQVNTAALISALLGINFPINSLGVAPLYYLKVSNEQQARIIHANALQLSEQYLMRHLNLKESTVPWLFRPYPELSERAFFEELRRLNMLLQNEEYPAVVNASYKAIDLFKYGLKYYNSYYQTMLLIFVTTGFIGWIAYLFISIRSLGTLQYENYKRLMDMYVRDMWNISGSVVAGVLVLCLLPLAGSLPPKFYVYILFPIFIWCIVLNSYKNGIVSIGYLLTFDYQLFLCIVASYILQIELLIMTFFKQYYLTALFFYLAIREAVHKINDYPLWIAGFLALGVCPLLTDLQTVFNYVIQIVALVLWIYYGYTLIGKITKYQDKQVLIFQFGLLFTAFVNTFIVDLTIRYEQGLCFVNQTISWVLLLSLLCPFFVSTYLQVRLISCFIALMTPYTLMAVGYESIFMYFFVQHMLNWIDLEHSLKHPFASWNIYYDFSRIPNLTHTDRRTVKHCYYLLAFTMLSYFGTGNNASISSFDPMWTRCFVTVFSPYTMTGLILIKLMIPFLIVMCTFRGVMLINAAQIRNTFLIILFFCDLMVLHFLYYVQNEGSWLEIGLSLSRFVVVNATTIVLLLLYQIALFLTVRKVTIITSEN